MGILEAFALYEEVGRLALSFDDMLFMADAKKRQGCRLQKRQLSCVEVKRVISVGEVCSAYKRNKKES